MSTAADLPDGSVVADWRTAYIKNHPTPTAQWRATNGSYLPDDLVDDAIVDGATVLRVGAGEDIGDAVRVSDLEAHMGRQIKTLEGWQTITAANGAGSVWTQERGSRALRLWASDTVRVRDLPTDVLHEQRGEPSRAHE